MADANDDLLDGDGELVGDFDLDGADEDALLADDYDDYQNKPQRTVNRNQDFGMQDDEDAIELGVQDEDLGLPEEDKTDMYNNRHSGEDNTAPGSVANSFKSGVDSDEEDSTRDRSRFKTERNITIRTRQTSTIPDSLDGVVVNKGHQPQQNPSRGGGRLRGNRGHPRGHHQRGGHYGGRPRPYNHQDSPQGMPPRGHPPFGPPGGGGGPPPLLHQHQMPPRHHYPHPPNNIHVNPHFRPRLPLGMGGGGGGWQGLQNNNYPPHQGGAPQMGGGGGGGAPGYYQQEPQFNNGYNNSYPPPRGPPQHWNEGPPPPQQQQNFYQDPPFNSYEENSYYNGPAQEPAPYYQQPHQLPGGPPPNIPPYQQPQANNWEGGNSNYYPPNQPEMYGGGGGGPPQPPQHHQHHHPQQQHHHHHQPQHHHQPPPPPQQQMHNSPHNHQQHQGPPQYNRGPNQPRPQHLQQQQQPQQQQQQFRQPPNNNSNYQGKARVTKLKMAGKEKHLSAAKLAMKALRQEQLKKFVRNLQTVPTVDNLPDTTTSTVEQEEEDEEMKEYRLKIEAQKKLREEILRLKEEKRAEAAQLRQKQVNNGVTQATTVIDLVQKAAELKEKTMAADSSLPSTEQQFRTVRLKTKDGKTIVKRLSLAEIEKLRKVQAEKKAAANAVTPDNTNKANTAENKGPEPATSNVDETNGTVVVNNLSASTRKKQLLDMARQVGAVQSVELLSGGRAKLRFVERNSAVAFQKKFQRKMVDLSMISISLGLTA